MAPRNKAFLVEFVNAGSASFNSTLAIGNGPNAAPMFEKAQVAATKRPYSGEDMTKHVKYSISDFADLKNLLTQPGRKKNGKK